MNRLREIAKEVEELDKQAEGNELYQKVSKLFCETATIQAQDIQESNKRVHRFIEQHKSLQVTHYQVVELNDLMYDFIVTNGLLSELQGYIEENESAKVLH